MRLLKRFLSLIVSSVFVATAVSHAHGETLRLAVTTSFHNSGLSEVLLPAIKADTGLNVRLLVVGTGQALTLGRAGDVDAVLVHSRKAEDAFVEAGHATHRRDLMYNDFVLVGPSNDPANVGKARDILEALSMIADRNGDFVSRGDDSGTHRRELSLWQAADRLPDASKQTWYREAGSGMGATLNTAAGLNAYVLADRASWLNFGNTGDLTILFEGDDRLFNPYGYLPVNPERHPHVNADGAMRLEAWLTGKRGQEMIGDFRINGEAVFVPAASPVVN